MAFTEIYVDPSIAADSGAGTIGDPFGDLEYAIEQTTFDTTNGTRVNIKTGTDEVLAANLATALANTTTTPAWVPTAAAPCIFQGYTSAAGDGGIGGISGGGSVSVLLSATLDYISLIDLHLHNTGANTIIDLDNNCSVIGCELDNATTFGLRLDLDCVAMNNYIHNVGGTGLELGGGVIAFNRIENGTTSVTHAINAVTGDVLIYRNIIKISGTSNGILAGTNSWVMSNSVFSDGGTGYGIAPNAANRYLMAVMNNVVEGFSGTGGIGFDMGTLSGTVIVHYSGNSAYDNATEFVAPNRAIYSSGNETLSATPFTDAVNGDFAPVDTGSIKEGVVPAFIGDSL